MISFDQISGKDKYSCYAVFTNHHVVYAYGQIWDVTGGGQFPVEYCSGGTVCSASLPCNAGVLCKSGVICTIDAPCTTGTICNIDCAKEYFRATHPVAICKPSKTQKYLLTCNEKVPNAVGVNPFIGGPAFTIKTVAFSELGKKIIY